MGGAGHKLNASTERLGMSRDQVRVGNVISCRPPGNELVGTSWEHGAIAHCRVHRRKLEDHHVYVTLGVTPTRTMLKEIHGIEYGGKLENWRGYVIGDGPPYIIPTYHPSHLLQGQQRLTGVFLHDIKRAMEVASFGLTRSQPSLVQDPPPEWFSAWVESLPQDDSFWMAVDIETPIKIGDSEDDLEVPVGDIVRVNFAIHPDEGVTVPWGGRYDEAIRAALRHPCPKVFGNAAFDVPILRDKGGIDVAGQHLDGMWAWHMLQSDVPKGLGFVAPFYSDLPPWKHLSDADPSYYGAMDGVQQLRLMFGIAKDLQRSGQWDSFLTNSVKLDSMVLRPMEKVGLLIDGQRLRSFQENVREAEAKLFAQLQAMIPEEVKPLAGGWKRKPATLDEDTLIVREVERQSLMCTACGAEGVEEEHQCP